MTSPNTLTAVLLTGGLSTRMGADKAALVVSGEPLWSRQLHLLRELSPACLKISARTDPAWRPTAVDIILDREPSRGPLSGLAAAFENLSTSHLLVLAVDLPRMTAEHLHALWSLARPGRGVVPQRQNHFEPLCAIYPAEAAAFATAALRTADVSLQSFVRILHEHHLMESRLVSPAEESLYENINTPDDLTRVAAPRRLP